MAMIGRPANVYVPADFTCRGEAVHDRHLTVHEDPVEAVVAGQDIQCFLPWLAMTTAIPADAQKFGREFLIEFVVLNQQQACAAQSPREIRVARANGSKALEAADACLIAMGVPPKVSTTGAPPNISTTGAPPNVAVMGGVPNASMTGAPPNVPTTGAHPTPDDGCTAQALWARRPIYPATGAPPNAQRWPPEMSTRKSVWSEPTSTASCAGGRR